MKNILLLAVLFICIPSQAGVLGTLFKAVKQGVDEVPMSVKTPDSEIIKSKMRHLAI
jgi:hypothetical protein